MSAEEYVRDNHPDPDSVADTGEKWSSIFAMMNGYSQHKADEQSIEFIEWLLEKNVDAVANRFTTSELLARFKQEKQ